jgi:hypothetical protein
MNRTIPSNEAAFVASFAKATALSALFAVAILTTVGAVGDRLAAFAFARPFGAICLLPLAAILGATAQHIAVLSCRFKRWPEVVAAINLGALALGFAAIFSAAEASRPGTPAVWVAATVAVFAALTARVAASKGRVDERRLRRSAALSVVGVALVAAAFVPPEVAGGWAVWSLVAFQRVATNAAKFWQACDDDSSTFAANVLFTDAVALSHRPWTFTFYDGETR